MKLSTFFTIVIIIILLGAAFVLYVKFNQPKRVFFNSNFELQIGQLSYFPSQNLSISFEDVKSDSRCASDVQCIKQGQVTLILEVIKESSEQTIELTSGEGNESRINVFGYDLNLLNVEPYPISTQQTEKSDYTAGFNISKIIEIQ